MQPDYAVAIVTASIAWAFSAIILITVCAVYRKWQKWMLDQKYQKLTSNTVLPANPCRDFQDRSSSRDDTTLRIRLELPEQFRSKQGSVSYCQDVLFRVHALRLPPLSERVCSQKANVVISRTQNRFSLRGLRMVFVAGESSNLVRHDVSIACGPEGSVPVDVEVIEISKGVPSPEGRGDAEQGNIPTPESWEGKDQLPLTVNPLTYIQRTASGSFGELVQVYKVNVSQESLVLPSARPESVGDRLLSSLKNRRHNDG
eukprot:2513668-Pyramimonas_sp.AAC.1